MLYYSTATPTHRVGLKEAVLRPLPPDDGLYMPEALPTLDPTFWEIWRELTFPEIGIAVADAFFGADIPPQVLADIIEDTLTFDAPLVPLGPGDHILELFHGPTLACKDFGVRLMARLMAWLTRGEDRELTVLVATSGDTGGAVAAAFHGVPNIRVVILYPQEKVSFLPEKQLTTLGGNITALEIQGTFDDCLTLAKSALLDREFSERLNLTSGNSINLARLVPQIFYFIHAARQLPEGVKPTFVMPSGNFGNLTAGLLAMRIGLPVDHFVVASNHQDVVPEFLRTNHHQRRSCVDALNVAASSNFSRIHALFDGSWEITKHHMTGMTFTDDQTRAAIRTVKALYQYDIDPRGAMAWLAAQRWRASHRTSATIALATAHPAKLIEVMEAELGTNCLVIPERLATLAQRDKFATLLPANPVIFREWLDAFC